jgi:hypothetical protein
MGTYTLRMPTGRTAPMSQKYALLAYPGFAMSFGSFKFTLHYLA